MIARVTLVIAEGFWAIADLVHTLGNGVQWTGDRLSDLGFGVCDAGCNAQEFIDQLNRDLTRGGHPS